MNFSRTRMLFIGMLTLSIIIFLQGKSFVPTACYFLIMAAIIDVSKQADWIYKKLNQPCESNDIEDIKKTWHSNLKKDKLPDKYFHHAWPDDENKLEESKREKIQQSYSMGLSQDYFIQEYRRYLQDMVLFGKLKIEEVPQRLRVNGGRSFYVTAIRYAREHRNCKRYVLSCQVQHDDMSSVYLSSQDREDFVRDIWHAMWIGVDYFEEEKEFQDFLEEQKKLYPELYRDWETN